MNRLFNFARNGGTGRLMDVKKEMEIYRLDSLGLIKTRLTGFGELITRDGYTYMHSGKENDNHRKGCLLYTSRCV